MPTLAEDLGTLADLRRAGDLTSDQFAEAKAFIISEHKKLAGETSANPSMGSAKPMRTKFPLKLVLLLLIAVLFTPLLLARTGSQSDSQTFEGVVDRSPEVIEPAEEAPTVPSENASKPAQPQAPVQEATAVAPQRPVNQSFELELKYMDVDFAQQIAMNAIIVDLANRECRKLEGYAMSDQNLALYCDGTFYFVDMRRQAILSAGTLQQAIEGHYGRIVENHVSSDGGTIKVRVAR